MSTDELSGAQSVVESLDLGFPILYDPDGSVPRDYGVFNLLGDGLATSSTFVVDKEGNIRWKYVASHIDDQPSTNQVIQRLQALQGS